MSQASIAIFIDKDGVNCARIAAAEYTAPEHNGCVMYVETSTCYLTFHYDSPATARQIAERMLVEIEAIEAKRDQKAATEESVVEANSIATTDNKEAMG